MKHVMIDLETLSLRSNAAIIEIAAKEFNPNKDIEVAYNAFHIFVDAASCAMYGMDFGMNTIAWWASQKKSLKEPFDTFRNDCPIGYALDKLAEFLRNTAPDGDVTVWSQGSDFDIAVLKTAFRTVLGKEFPVMYRNVRDARTYFLGIVDAKKPETQDPFKLVESEEERHKAQGDVNWSIKAVQYAYDLLTQSDTTDNEEREHKRR